MAGLDVPDLNEWFSLDHYSDLPKWGVDLWYLALHSRIGLDSWLIDPQSNAHAIAQYFREITENPLAPTGELRLNPARIFPAETGGQSVFASSSLVDISGDPLAGVARQREAWDYVDRWKEDGPESNDLVRIVAIDLTAPDALIEREFRTWLRQARAEAKPVPQVSASDLRNWTDAKVLQYLDFMLWAKAKGTHLGQVKLADLLFPDAYGSVSVTERLRKVTVKYAKRLLTPGFIFRMEIEASAILASNSSMDGQGAVPE